MHGGAATDLNNNNIIAFCKKKGNKKLWQQFKRSGYADELFKHPIAGQL
jgi:hypothetical protein